MKNSTAIIINIYVVPLIAVLLSFFGIIKGGTGVAIIDITIYLVNFILVYALAYFFLNYFSNIAKVMASIFIYLLIIISLTFYIHFSLLILLIPIFIHLIFYTKKNKDELNFDEPLLKFLFKALPKKNKKIIYGYMFITYAVGILLL